MDEPIKSFAKNRKPDMTRPRVLHLIGSLGIGGIEMWLMHMFRHQDMFSVRHEVLLTKEEPGPHEKEAKRLGIKLHRLPLGRSKLTWPVWLWRFRRFLRREGPFDVVHSHLSLFSGLTLAAAKTAGVPARLAHCHDARSKGADFQSPQDKLLRASMIAAMRRSATDRIGISTAAIEEIAGPDWTSDPLSRILFYGFDFSKAEGARERGAGLREQLGIGPGARVIGHVGRFDPVKNHELLLQALLRLRTRGGDFVLVFVGDGPVRPAIQSRAAALGLGEYVRFPGASNDVPGYMGLFDVLALPSFSEGLGIVVLEAQAAGTRSLVSENVPGETAIVPGAVEHLDLAAGPHGWADAIERIATAPRENPDSWLATMAASRFGIRRCVEELDQIYRTAIERAA